MDFWGCVIECALNRELVANYDRLYGASMSRVVIPRSAIEAMIDDATGFKRDELLKFAAFVHECVWTRLPDECFTEEPSRA